MKNGIFLCFSLVSNSIRPVTAEQESKEVPESWDRGRAKWKEVHLT